MSELFLKQAVGAVVRTSLAALAGSGLLSSDSTEQLAGAITTALVIGWSVYQKWQANKAIATVVPTA